VDAALLLPEPELPPEPAPLDPVPLDPDDPEVPLPVDPEPEPVVPEPEPSVPEPDPLPVDPEPEPLPSPLDPDPLVPEPVDPEPVEPDPLLPLPEPALPDPEPAEPEPELLPLPLDPDPLDPEPEVPLPFALLPEPPVAPPAEAFPDPLPACAVEFVAIEPHPATSTAVTTREREPAVQQRVFTMSARVQNSSAPLGLADTSAQDAAVLTGRFPAKSSPRSAFSVEVIQRIDRVICVANHTNAGDDKPQ
jgi:hypothetical protein